MKKLARKKGNSYYLCSVEEVLNTPEPTIPSEAQALFKEFKDVF